MVTLNIVPTSLNILSVSNNTKDYSNGYNIFSNNYYRDNVFVPNWNDNAIITSKYTYIFSNMPNKVFKNKIRFTYTYKKITNDEKVNSKLVLDIMNQNRRFLK